MANFKLLALTNALEGRDEEFNRWYDDVHLADLLRMPQVKAATRYRLVDVGAFPKNWQYLSIYDLECDDPKDVINDINALVAEGKMVLTQAVSIETALALVAEPMRP